MEQRTDEALVGRVLGGDPEAFTDLVRKHQDYAYAVAISLLADFDLAHDVVQEAFLAAYRTLSQLRRRERFRAWLCSIVRRMAYRAVREVQKARALAEDLAETATPDDSTPSPHAQLEVSERRKMVTRALRRLNFRSREIVTLCYVHDLSYAEIAEFLGVTVATVNGRLQRARAQLKEELRMVEDTFKEQSLSDRFPEEIRRLLRKLQSYGEQREAAIERLAEVGEPYTDLLCQAVERTSRGTVQNAVARALCKMGTAQAHRLLMRLLTAEDNYRYWEVFRDPDVLRVAGVRDALLDYVSKETNRANRDNALWALSHAKDDDVVFERLYQVFEEEGGLQSETTKHGLLGCLCRLRPQIAQGLVEEALLGGGRRLRRWAVRCALDSDVLPSLDACAQAALSMGTRGHRLHGMELMLKHGEAGRERLRALMRSGTEFDQNSAALVLAEEGCREGSEVLERSLSGSHDGRLWLREIAGAISRHHGGDRFGWLANHRLDDIPSVVWGQRGEFPESLLPEVERLYCEGGPSQRAAAIRVLAHKRGMDFAEELRACLRAGKPKKVAREALEQLQRLGEQAEPLVREMLTSKHWSERKAALTLLHRWGRLGTDILERVKTDSHIALRKLAVFYLSQTTA